MKIIQKVHLYNPNKAMEEIELEGDPNADFCWLRIRRENYNVTERILTKQLLEFLKKMTA